MQRSIVTAAAQMGPIARADSRAQGVDRLIALLHEAHGRGAERVVFSELTLTTFFPRWYLTEPSEIDVFFESSMARLATPWDCYDTAMGIGRTKRIL